jgi:hypothetical protein
VSGGTTARGSVVVVVDVVVVGATVVVVVDEVVVGATVVVDVVVVGATVVVVGATVVVVKVVVVVGATVVVVVDVVVVGATVVVVGATVVVVVVVVVPVLMRAPALSATSASPMCDALVPTRVVVPEPRRPLPPLPQHFTDASSSIAQVCASPADTASTV